MQEKGEVEEDSRSESVVFKKVVLKKKEFASVSHSPERRIKRKPSLPKLTYPSTKVHKTVEQPEIEPSAPRLT